MQIQINYSIKKVKTLILAFFNFLTEKNIYGKNTSNSLLKNLKIKINKVFQYLIFKMWTIQFYIKPLKILFKYKLN